MKVNCLMAWKRVEVEFEIQTREEREEEEEDVGTEKGGAKKFALLTLTSNSKGREG